MPAYRDKPFYAYISIDLFFRVLSQTFLHPILPWFLPLALRAQAYSYSHPPLYLSILYALLSTTLYLLSHLNHRLAYGPPRQFDWTNEVICITGGASGLGLLIAEVYGMRGVPVAVLDNHIPPAESEARNVHFYHCDVGDPAAVESCKEQIERDLDGRVSVLINNAAVLRAKNILDLSRDDLESSYRTNVLAHYNTIRCFLPGMIAANRGTVVTMSSVLGTLPPAGCGAYAPAKAAVAALHHILTAELEQMKASGVKTLLVASGQMSTPLFAGVETPSTFWAPVLEPVDVAKEVIAAVDAGRGGEVTLPLFAKWAAVFWVLPVSVRRAARAWSRLDTAMKGYRGKGKEE